MERSSHICLALKKLILTGKKWNLRYHLRLIANNRPSERICMISIGIRKSGMIVNILNYTKNITKIIASCATEAAINIHSPKRYPLPILSINLINRQNGRRNCKANQRQTSSTCIEKADRCVRLHSKRFQLDTQHAVRPVTSGQVRQRSAKSLGSSWDQCPLERCPCSFRRTYVLNPKRRLGPTKSNWVVESQDSLQQSAIAAVFRRAWEDSDQTWWVELSFISNY